MIDFRNHASVSPNKKVTRKLQVHCKVIIGRNPIEANANTVAIQLPGNPVAYIGKCFTPYQEFLQPLQVNYHLLANYPQKLKQFPVQAKGFADRSVKYLYYTYNLPIYIYSVSYEIWQIDIQYSHTVVCIKDGKPSFLRFWKNHPQCRKKCYLI